MKIKRWFLDNSIRNYQYLLYNKSQVIAVDPLRANKYLEFISQNDLDLIAIIITHNHYDHISGVKNLIEEFPQAKIYAYGDNKIFKPDIYVQDGNKYNLNFCEFEVLFIPGHTYDHVSFLFRQEKALFCGDTIFNAGVGNIKDPTANITQLTQSILKIMQLNNDIMIYSAHDYWEANLNFALSILPNDDIFNHYKQIVVPLKAEHKPILSLYEEKRVNIFMRAFNDENLLKVISKNSLGPQMFIYLRYLKDILNI